MSDGASTPRQELADEDRLWVVDIVAPLPPGRVRLVAADAAARLNLPAEKLVSLLENRIGPVTKPLPHRSAHRVAEVLNTAGAEVEMRSARSTDGPPSAERAAAGAGARDAVAGARGGAASPSTGGTAAPPGWPATSTVVPARRKTDPRPHDPWRAIADDAEGRDVDDAMLGGWRRGGDPADAAAAGGRDAVPARASDRPEAVDAPSRPPDRAVDAGAVADTSPHTARDTAPDAAPDSPPDTVDDGARAATPDAPRDAAPDAAPDAALRAAAGAAPGVASEATDDPALDRGGPVVAPYGASPRGGDPRERPDPPIAGGDEAGTWSPRAPGGAGAPGFAGGPGDARTRGDAGTPGDAGGPAAVPGAADDPASDVTPAAATPAAQDAAAAPAAPPRSTRTASVADVPAPSAPSADAPARTPRRRDGFPADGTSGRADAFDDPRVAPVRTWAVPRDRGEAVHVDAAPRRPATRSGATAVEPRDEAEEEDHGFGFGMRDPFAEQERRDRVLRRGVLAGALVLALAAFLALQWAYSRPGVAGATPPPYAEGLGAYRDGAFVSAARAWLPRAEAGDARAMFMLGYMAEIGQGRPWSNAEAAGWYRQAAERGHAPSQLRLAALYRRGMGLSHDAGAALSWTLAAAEAGLPRAQLEAARLLAIDGRHEEAFTWLRLAAEREPEAAAWLGVAGAVSDLNPRSE